MSPNVTRAALLVLLSAVLSACATARASGPAGTFVHPEVSRTGSGYVPHRVYDVAAGTFVDFETFAARAARADVVFFGEQHGHVPGHRMQHALLESLARRGGATLSLEMFERDVAPALDAYLRGGIPEATFLERSRPWPDYVRDYRPLVEEARARGWRVVAANVPRELASRVAQGGLAALAGAPATHVARDVRCPEDAYRTRFIAEMRRHPMPGSAAAHGAADPVADARDQRYYEAQCVKDETMAEAIAAALEGGTRPVVHVTGAFHTDHGDGVPARVLRRRPGTTVVSITMVPVADLDAADPAPHRARADYLLFTLAAPPPAR